LLETGAVSVSPNKPFTLTSGRLSPVYVDCRRLISFVDARRRLMEMSTIKLQHLKQDIDVLAGGETAGIAYAAYLSELMSKPMIYIRKKPKGFGRNARIEGVLNEGDQVVLVEDLATDGGSKLSFIEAIREIGATCHHCFVIFNYGVFETKMNRLEEYGIKMHWLCVWEDVLKVARQKQYLSEADCQYVRDFLDDPEGWQANQKNGQKI
ncbi:MAG: orotate phosphoribosyltransferase, partial [Pseudomonadota bacterium]